MGQKDISEKILESYSDVFADIVNGLLFEGKQIVKADELVEAPALSAYKADGKLRSQERDVSKYWRKGSFRISCIGIENQTSVDSKMPLRILSYDAAEYRKQYDDKSLDFCYPVVSLVLYFGYKKHWDRAQTLKQCLQVPKELDSKVFDYGMNLFEIAYLSRDQVNLFHSDFKIVADFFVQMRETGRYEASIGQYKHMQAVLDMLKAVNNDDRFDLKLCGDDSSKGEVKNMNEWLDKVLAESEAKGINSSRRQTAVRLKAEGMNDAFISKILGVSEQDVQEILKTVVM